MAAASGLLSDASKLAGNVVTVDDEGALDFETQGLERVWKVYSGQLQGLTPPTDLVEKSVRVTCLVTIAISAFFWIWAFSNLVSLGDPDIGFVAFALPLACNVWGWQSTRDSFAADERLHYATRYKYAPLAHLAVSVAYILGFLAVKDTGFRFYCVLFGSIWAWTAYCVRNLSDTWYWIVHERSDAEYRPVSQADFAESDDINDNGEDFNAEI
jgi:hypothetical protein